MIVIILKPTEMKEPEISKPENESCIQPRMHMDETGIHEDEIFKELDIVQRTQKPPSEELITRLNQLASKPPFSYTQKVKENNPL